MAELLQDVGPSGINLTTQARPKPDAGCPVSLRIAMLVRATRHAPETHQPAAFLAEQPWITRLGKLTPSGSRPHFR